MISFIIGLIIGYNLGMFIISAFNLSKGSDNNED